MAHTAHLLTASADRGLQIVVCDEQGVSITEWQSASTSAPGEADSELRAAGWTRSAEWNIAKDGWLAPVVPS